MQKQLISIIIALGYCLLSQATSIRGRIKDADSNESLSGATILLAGSNTGTATGFDGSFVLSNMQAGTHTLKVTFLGYLEKEVVVKLDANTIDCIVPTIALQSDAIGLNEVKVQANMAIDRKTPIAASNITPLQIAEKLGTQEFPEILKSTPGIYTTKRGGGWGDASVRIRGFGSTNIAVLINGMPVNGMEDDKVYWSNWAGLADVTRAMQVQRGVGASKIAVPSVGGTINVLTKTTDAQKGGHLFYNVGNNNYQKIGATVSSGLTHNNWAMTISLSKTKGDGYVDGTPFEGYSYFLNVSKKLNEQHQFSLTLFGAPQEHAQRYEQQPLSILKSKPNGHTYNADWGYLNGEFYSNSVNFYHKPVAILNHFYTINASTFLSTSLYASYGMGGGGYVSENAVTLSQDAYGQINWDKAVSENIMYAQKGKGGGLYFQNSYNNHRWFGALSSLKRQLGDIELMTGADLRYYYGEHWQQVDDLFGASFIYDKRNKNAVNLYNKTAKEGDVIYYDNDGEVAWEGLFVQAEYSKNKITAFASTTISNRSYRRYDFAQYFSDAYKAQLKTNVSLVNETEARLQEYLESNDYGSIFESEAYTVDQKTAWQHFLGFSTKAGTNYNLNDRHNLFVNAGYMERQPTFSTVFQNYKNLINQSAVNEKVISAEVGYGYRGPQLTANINAYYTLWNDKTITGNIADTTSADPNERLIFNIEGVNARHMGLEFDGVYKPTKKLTITGMVSLGDWIWNNTVDTVKIFKDQVMVGRYNAVYLQDLHVADAAQTTAAIGINYELLPGFKIGTDFNYYDRLYADFDIESRTNPNNKGVDAERIPAYLLMDLNLYYRFQLGQCNASLYGNMNNVLNTIYIADATEGEGYYFGFGRTISMGLKLNF